MAQPTVDQSIVAIVTSSLPMHDIDVFCTAAGFGALDNGTLQMDFREKVKDIAAQWEG